MLVVPTSLIKPNLTSTIWFLPLLLSLFIISGFQERNLSQTQLQGQHKYVLARASIQRDAAIPKFEERKDLIKTNGTKNCHNLSHSFSLPFTNRNSYTILKTQFLFIVKRSSGCRMIIFSFRIGKNKFNWVLNLKIRNFFKILTTKEPLDLFKTQIL